MKLALRGLLVLAVAGIATRAGVAAPARLITVPYSGFFWTPHDGLLGVGLCASTKWRCGTGAVELTTDGGRTYHVIFRTRRPVIELQAIGRHGALARAYRHNAWRTLDRGRTWTEWPMRDGVSFATPAIGLGFRIDQVRNTLRLRLLHTKNAGRTWERVPTPAHCFSDFPLLDLVNSQLGWMLCGGQPGAGNEAKSVYRTADGGRTWRELASTPMTGRAPRGGIGSIGYPAGISFARNGFGLMWESRGTLYVTRDGGKTWSTHTRFAVFDVDFGLGGSAFANGTGFVLLEHGGTVRRLIETRDYGRHWHIVRTWAR
jgi:photosystem II stability/assembly factor-like uncharacterized protein